MSHDIAIAVETDFLEDESDPPQERYVFSYTITIRNQGDQAAKLLSRRWLITDANGQVREVEGDGVVGEQPFIRPGEGFQYTSGAILETPVGTMEGSYRMEDDNGQAFEAAVEPFTLAVPGMLH